MKRPRIVCLCGSTRFKKEFEQAAKQETLAGKIVLSVGYFGHQEQVPPTEDQKRLLDRLHLEKILLADEVLFLNVNGYMGTSTKRELQFASNTKKVIRFLEAGTRVPSPCAPDAFGVMCLECQCDPDGGGCGRESCLHCALGVRPGGTDW
jgi:hypothetical protein